jgi:hypothetical protein
MGNERVETFRAQDPDGNEYEVGVYRESVPEAGLGTGEPTRPTGAITASAVCLTGPFVDQRYDVVAQGDRYEMTIGDLQVPLTRR